MLFSNGNHNDNLKKNEFLKLVCNTNLIQLLDNVKYLGCSISIIDIASKGDIN